MVRWLLAGSLALTLSAGPARTGEEASANVQPAGPPAGSVQVSSAQDAKQQDTKQQETQPRQEPNGEEKREEAPAAEAPKAPKTKWHINGEAEGYVGNNFNDPFNDKNQLRAFDVYDVND